MNDEHIYFDENCLKSAPLLIGDVKEAMYNLDKSYRFLETCDDKVKEFLLPTLNHACDQVCEMCYELGFDSPEQVECNPYSYWFVTDYKSKGEK